MGLYAQRGGGSAGGGAGHASAHSAGRGGANGGTTGATSKTVHVQQYTRKDGTVVMAHDRAAPGTATPKELQGKEVEYEAEELAQVKKQETFSNLSTAKATFREEHACPYNNRVEGACPGFQIGTIAPTACDAPERVDGLRWMTLEAFEAQVKIREETCQHKQPAARLP